MPDLSSTPFTLEPLAVPRPWGGTRARSFAQLPASSSRSPIGEWWLLSARPQAPTCVSSGAHRGVAFHELLPAHGRQLCGDEWNGQMRGRFPLLLKLLDARERLSVQIHPFRGPERKNESWYVLDAAAGAELMIGLKPGCRLLHLIEAVENGTLVEDLLMKHPAHAGTSAHIPSGLIHAFGEEILAIEVQENSDTTYRIFDWNRQPPRTLHVAEARQAASPDQSASPPTAKTLAKSPFFHELLVECDSYRMERLCLDDRAPLPHADSFQVLVPLDGPLQLRHGARRIPAPRGNAVFIPAGSMDIELEPGPGRIVMRVLPS